jgi:hypothetical protein
MERSVTFNEKDGLIQERDENVDRNLSFVLGKVGNEEFFIILLDPQRSTVLGRRSKHDVGQREYLTLGFVDLVNVEFEVLSLS